MSAAEAPLRERSYRQAARTAARRALREDLAGYGDLTGSVFAGDGVARVVGREAGVVSGIAALEETARLIDPALDVKVLIEDGERFATGDCMQNCAARWRRSWPPSAQRSTSSAG